MDQDITLLRTTGLSKIILLKQEFINYLIGDVYWWSFSHTDQSVVSRAQIPVIN